MKRRELDAFLDFLDRNSRWMFSFEHAMTYFAEPANTLRHSLARHAKAGIVLRVVKGLYANPRSKHFPTSYVLEHSIKYIRPRELSYISLETLLSSIGVISQVPYVLTVMSTGRSYRYSTPWGDIEFTHTDRPRNEIRKEVTFDNARGAFIAPPQIAYRDLKRVGRNLNLINDEELETAIEEWEAEQGWVALPQTTPSPFAKCDRT